MQQDGYAIWIYLIASWLIKLVFCTELTLSSTNITVNSLPARFSCTFNVSDVITEWRMNSIEILSNEMYNVTTYSTSVNQVKTNLLIQQPLPTNQQHLLTCSSNHENGNITYYIEVFMEDETATIPLQNSTMMEPAQVLIPQRNTGSVVAVGVTEICLIATVAVLLLRKRQKIEQKKAKHKVTKKAKEVEMVEVSKT